MGLLYNKSLEVQNGSTLNRGDCGKGWDSSTASKSEIACGSPCHLNDSGRANAVAETALLSESALAEDWNRPEEDEAWAHLQSDK
jgi:hypothetical protein